VKLWEAPLRLAKISVIKFKVLLKMPLMQSSPKSAEILTEPSGLRIELPMRWIRSNWL
jgi:hypothetical protein